MCLSCKCILHTYITLTSIKLCFLIVFDRRQLVSIQPRGLLGISCCFFFFFPLPETELWRSYFHPGVMIHSRARRIRRGFIKPRPQSVPMFGHNLESNLRKNKGVLPKILQVLRGNHLNYAQEKYMRSEARLHVRASARSWALRYLGNKLCEHRMVRMWMLGELAIS